MSPEYIDRRRILSGSAATAIAATCSGASALVPKGNGFQVIARAPDLIWNGAVFAGKRLFASIPSWIGPTPGVVEVHADGRYEP